MSESAEFSFPNGTTGTMIGATEADVLRRIHVLRLFYDWCERCGFVPIDMCQLDVVHIDGCGDVSDPSSYLTLCANCQTFRAAMNNDDLSPEDREAVREAWRLSNLFN